MLEIVAKKTDTCAKMHLTLHKKKKKIGKYRKYCEDDNLVYLLIVVCISHEQINEIRNQTECKQIVIKVIFPSLNHGRSPSDAH